MKTTQRQLQLAARRAEYDAMIKRGLHDSGKQKRITSGGYRRPGVM